MAFPAEARRVRDETLLPAARLRALKRCVSAYAPYGYHRTLALLVRAHGRLDRPRAMCAALDTLERSRRHWQATMAALAQLRYRTRRSGRRPPLPYQRHLEREVLGGHGWPGGLPLGSRRAARLARRPVQVAFLVRHGALSPARGDAERQLRAYLSRRDEASLRRRGAVRRALAVCLPLAVAVVVGTAMLIKPWGLTRSQFAAIFTPLGIAVWWLYDVLVDRFGRARGEPQSSQ
ncbi:hypothetical protein Cme02nite_62270 [Catellatospora methionotrophica]|uniref:Uncharacterized protein n=1 Tax=Catellatospora methionotrophica TaxID=121620 RepID=A0A8J3LS44_9ACTN|nr:hypothetical protein [Catellatospora methionotrophica]GIG17895.1 hypothetical protein Cme02nite_62270 [Catellatospora methionotrophica]